MCSFSSIKEQTIPPKIYIWESREQSIPLDTVTSPRLCFEYLKQENSNQLNLLLKSFRGKLKKNWTYCFGQKLLQEGQGFLQLQLEKSLMFVSNISGDKRPFKHFIYPWWCKKVIYFCCTMKLVTERLQAMELEYYHSDHRGSWSL